MTEPTTEVVPSLRGDGATSARARRRTPARVAAPLRLLVRLAITLLGLLTLLFFLVRLSGDPAGVLAGPSATPAEIEAVRAGLGLDRSLGAQYLTFLGDAARLDFGDSVFSGDDALSTVLAALPATLALLAATLVVSIVVGVPAGVALSRGPRALRRVIGGLLTLAQALPTFVIGVVLITTLAVEWGLLPSYGSGTFAQLVMPTIALSTFAIARTARMVAAELDQVWDQDFLRTAAAKGASPRRVLWAHALPNASPAVVSAIVVEVSYLLSGAVVVEVLFAYDGIGKRLVDAIFARDYPLVQASVFVIGVIVVLVNVLGDVALRAIDPRATRETA